MRFISINEGYFKDSAEPSREPTDGTLLQLSGGDEGSSLVPLSYRVGSIHLQGGFHSLTGCRLHFLTG